MSRKAVLFLFLSVIVAAISQRALGQCPGPLQLNVNGPVSLNENAALQGAMNTLLQRASQHCATGAGCGVSNFDPPKVFMHYLWSSKRGRVFQVTIQTTVYCGKQPKSALELLTLSALRALHISAECFEMVYGHGAIAKGVSAGDLLDLIRKGAKIDCE